MRSLPQPTYSPTRSSPSALVFFDEPLLGQKVHRVPVTPGLTHRSRLDVAERGDARWRRRRVGWTGRGCTRGRRCPPRRPSCPRGTGPRPGTTVPGWWNKYICMSGGMPSGGVLMFALSTWLPSGSPPSRFAPSMALACTASPSTASKLPAASVKPIGRLARWSWNLPRKKNSWVAFWLAFVRQELGVSGSHEQTNPVAQLSPPNGVKG